MSLKVSTTASPKSAYENPVLTGWSMKKIFALELHEYGLNFVEFGPAIVHGPTLLLINWSEGRKFQKTTNPIP